MMIMSIFFFTFRSWIQSLFTTRP